jgi:glutamyl/glutaminyl-tRNA synthetase
MRISFGGWLLSVGALSVTSTVVHGFAYAPNFITKSIQEDTGITPTIKEERQDSPSDSLPVKTRFPPEPNGYLHLGHAKAVSFNFEVARMFHGTCNLRMDDTNPTKEDEEYVESILEDVKWIQSGLYDDADTPWEGSIRKTSSYFDNIYECAETLIKQGDAYVDSLSAEEMREYRGSLTEPGKDSPYRTRSVEENMDLFSKVRPRLKLSTLEPVGKWISQHVVLTLKHSMLR